MFTDIKIYVEFRIFIVTWQRFLKLKSKYATPQNSWWIIVHDKYTFYCTSALAHIKVYSTNKPTQNNSSRYSPKSARTETKQHQINVLPTRYATACAEQPKVHCRIIIRSRQLHAFIIERHRESGTIHNMQYTAQLWRWVKRWIN